MHKQYKTRELTLEQKRDLCYRAKEKCDRWWTDILDCSKSFCRQSIEMSFEDIMAKLDQKCHFAIIHRNNSMENYLEVGFSTMGRGPDYFLWINLDIKYLEEFTKDLGENYV